MKDVNFKVHVNCYQEKFHAAHIVTGSTERAM